jgi:phosphoglycerol transferase
MGAVGPGARQARHLSARREAAFATLAAVGSLLGGIVFLRSWRGDLGVPLDYFGDVNLQHLLVKSVLEEGWYFENARLGAPLGLELYDYPVLNGDTLNVLLLWTFGIFGAGSAAAMNLLYLLSFPLVGLTAFLALRLIGADRWPALVCSVLYALLPYHFIRGEGHLFLSTYYAVPVGAYLAWAIMVGDRLRLGVVVGLSVLVGVASGSFYYAAFTLLLVVVATVLRFAGTRDRRALVTGGIVAGTLIAVSLVQLAPTLVYRAANGSNDEVAQRFTFESEVYSLRMTQLVLPIDGHRVDALARLKQRYTEKFPPIDANAASLGVVGTVGFFGLLVVVIGALIGRRARESLVGLAILALTAFLVATAGGFGTLIGVVFAQIRAWNRLSIFIAFFALAAVALLLSALGRRVRPAVFAAVLVGVFTVGVADQTSDAFIRPYEVLRSQWRNDEAFFSSLESRLPNGAQVVNLPYEPFPEPPSGRQAVYEPVKSYLHTDRLRWSYGAMRGRPEDWAAANATRPAAELVPAAREAGFAAILVDRLGYGDDGAAAAADLRGVLGVAPERSPDGRYLFWPL